MLKKKFILSVEKYISLPTAVDTHAVMVQWKEQLWILINKSSKGTTEVLRVNNSFKIEIIKILPILSTTMVPCNDQLIISGADKDGKPVILSIDNNGTEQYSINLKMTPTIWPIVVCGENPIIVWQEEPKKIERGIWVIISNKIEKLEPIIVDGPSAELFSWYENIWASFRKNENIKIVNLITDEIYSTINPNPITIGKSDAGVYYGWAEKSNVCIRFQKEEDAHCQVVKNASLGNLRAVSGGEPLLWVQNQETDIEDNFLWNSTLIGTDVENFRIKGFVFDVAFWQDRIAVIDSSKITLLKKIN